MGADLEVNGSEETGNGVATEVVNGTPTSEKGASRSKKRREKKKAAKAQAKSAEPDKQAEPASAEAEKTDAQTKAADAAPDVEIEYVAAPMELEEDEENPIYEEFKAIFDKFKQAEEAQAEGEGEEEAEEAEEEKKPAKKEKKKKAQDNDDEEEDDEDDSDSDEDDEENEKISKKKKKMLRRLKIAELKQFCQKPEVVEIWDTTAQDARLLVYLKAYRNTVPVPRHWCQKRKFLQGKRGIEKPPWQLPAFIEATGIAKMRQAYQEKEDQKKLKNKQRDKMQPKMGKMNIDYQVLHDAFFKFATKPKMTKVGDMYYEGKEFEANHDDKKPGQISEDLRAALGMPPGAPPPWLIYMQRYGPPPSYPSLKIQGLNAPIPEGAKFGYEPGEWGKPPVDESGRPIYGDVFGNAMNTIDPYMAEVDKKAHWGELELEEEESEEEEDDEDEEDDDESIASMDDESVQEGMASMSSLPSGVETPDTIDLRKQKALYQVLEPQEASVGGALMGSSHTYVYPGAKKTDAAGTEITLRPEELQDILGEDEDKDKEAQARALQAKFEQHQQAEREASTAEDFSDMVAAQAQKQKRKAQAKEKEQKKKYKDFKF